MASVFVNTARRCARNMAILGYRLRGRVPWSDGYIPYKDWLLQRVLQDADQLSRFAGGNSLPAGYGYGVDERCVEFPWLVSRLEPTCGRLLDAGAALKPVVLDLPVMRERSVVAFNFAPGDVREHPGVTYRYGDLRKLDMEDESIDEIVCLSTMEHIGMDNTMLYSVEERHCEHGRDEWQKVVAEFRRALKPGGRAFISVPFGVHQSLGWLQQFDARMVEKMISAFGSSHAETRFYRYTAGGWQAAIAEDCSACLYHDVHTDTARTPDRVAAARAVACVEIQK